MQYLKQGATETLPVETDAVSLVLNGKPCAVPVKDQTLTLPTAETGRLDVTIGGVLREFMVIAPTSYDAIITGAALFPADVRRIMAHPVEPLVDFYQQGYDHEKHRIVGIDRVDSVGSVEKKVAIDDAAINESLKAVARNLVALHDQKRTVKADVDSVSGVSAVKVVNDLMAQFHKLAAKLDGVLRANIIQVLENPQGAVALNDLVTEGYNRDAHALRRVHSADKTGEVAKTVQANVEAFAGSAEAVKNAVKAFTPTGYDFPNSRIDSDATVQGVVRADVEKVAGVDADKLFKATDLKLDAATDRAGTQKTALLHVIQSLQDIAGVVKALAEDAADPSRQDVRVTHIGNSKEAVDNLKKAFTGEGYDFPNSTIITKASRREARRALRSAATEILNEKEQ